jgi:hypothetical protein
MTHTLTQTTRTSPHGGTETVQAPTVTNSHASILEGFMAWLPALAIFIGMPLLALATTKYVMLPTMKQIYAQETAVSQCAAPVFLGKIPLDASGARGAHSGFRSLELVGTDISLKGKVDQNKARLTVLAASDLRGKTVSDLDKPGALDALRTQLVADCNQVLGGPVVKDICIAVWP